MFTKVMCLLNIHMYLPVLITNQIENGLHAGKGFACEGNYPKEGERKLTVVTSHLIGETRF